MVVVVVGSDGVSGVVWDNNLCALARARFDPR